MSNLAFFFPSPPPSPIPPTDRAAAGGGGGSVGGGGYSTLGRRSTTTPDHYNITSPPPDHYLPPTRYNTYQPSAHAAPPPLTAHTHAPHTQNNGSLRRNQPAKLHFPKDYIRNGSMNIPVSSPAGGGGGVGVGVTSTYGTTTNKPQSPTRTHPPPHTPMLSTFAPDATQPPTVASVPLEHRGHLV